MKLKDLLEKLKDYKEYEVSFRSVNNHGYNNINSVDYFTLDEKNKKIILCEEWL